MEMTHTRTVSTASKDILARLLASEDISVEHRTEVETAYFDTLNRVLVLPVWEEMDNNMYDMLVGHEVGHALYTPADEWAQNMDRFGSNNRSLYQTFVNIVEDARIERMMKDKFPGLRRDFFNAYSDLADRDIFQIADKNLEDLPLIDRLNLEFKVGPHRDIPFTASEQKWITALENTKSFADVCDVAADLFDAWKQEQEENEPSTDAGQDAPGASDESGEDNPSQGASDSSDTDHEDNDGQSSSAMSGDSDADADQTENGSGSGDSQEGEDSGQSMTDDTDTGEGAESTQGEAENGHGDSNEESGENSDYQNDVNAACGTTQNAFDKAMQSLVDTEATQREYHSFPEFNLDNIIVDYKDVHREISASEKIDPANMTVAYQLYRDFERESRKTVNMMAQQFQRRQSADEAKRTSIAATGVLDVNKMHTYKWNEDLFLKCEEIAEGKNHGLVLFIDWSGSMSDIIEDTIKQMIQMVLFCKKVGIPFEVYSFSSNGTSRFQTENGEYGEVQQLQGGTDWTNTFVLNNYLSSRMNSREMKQALAHMMYFSQSLTYNGQYYWATPKHHDLGTTPLNEAIIAATQIVPKFQKANGLQIVNTMFLTDGDSSGGLYGHYTENWIRDEKTKKNYQASGRRNNNATTAALLEVLRDRTGANAVGIYLSNQKKLRHYYTVEQAAQYKKDGFVATDKAGYTEYFVVKANQKVENDFMDNIDSDASFTKIKNAFMKSSSNRVNSRVLLNRVIELIAA